MKRASDSDHESRRLDALRRLDLLDTGPEERFDRLTRLAAGLFRVPIALVSLVDAQRQWFKSHHGLDLCETRRDVSFCSQTIADGELLVVPDARRDPRFADNPLVVGEPHVVFYAGCPVRAPDGSNVGTLCLVDHVPRELDEQQRACLRDLARLVEQELSPIAALRSEGSAVAQSLMWPYGTGQLLARFAVTCRLAGLASRPAAAIAAAVVVALLIAGIAAWDRVAGSAHRAEARRQLHEHVDQHRARLEAALQARLPLAHGLAGFVHAQGRVDEDAFRRFASRLSAGRSGIRSLQLAPHGVVRHVFPLTGNEAAVGHDLFADPSRRAAAMHAVEQRRTVIAGPVELRQGGTALIARTPVFAGDPPGGGERFWGFAIVVVDFPSLLADAGLPGAEQGVRYALRVLADGGSTRPLFGDPAVFMDTPVTATVGLMTGTWELAALPEGGWLWRPQRTVLLTLGPALSLLAGLLVYFFLRLPSRLRNGFNEAVQALERSQLRFSDAIEALPDGFVVYDAQDRLVLCNENYRRFYRDSAPALREGNTFEAIVRYGYEHGQYADVESGLPIEELVERRIVQHRSADATLEQQLRDGRWIRIVERRMRDGGLVGFRVDITELKRKELELGEARERAEEANQAKSAFLATVSHEVRTPLNGVLGLLGLLREQPLSDVQRHYVDTAHRSGQQLLGILNEVLDISKLEAGRVELEPVPCVVQELLDGALSLVRPEADRKGLTLDLHCGAQVPEAVVADAGRLRQLLLNLLGNAVKFTADGRVSLAVSQCGGEPQRPRLRFEVTDTGPGVREEQVAYLFERFTQADSSTARRHGGTGLGLAICKHLVELMRGEIGVHAVPGGGACFWFEIPVQSLEVMPERRSQIRAADAIHLPRDTGSAPVRVLLAEDSPTNQMVVKAMLADTGYEVDTAADGKEAVIAVQSLPYDLVLMDISMPEMNGIEATKRIRAMSEREHLPIIALTANAMAGDKERFIAAGMDDYLAKPLRKQHLLHTLARWARLNARASSGPSVSRSDGLD